MVASFKGRERHKAKPIILGNGELLIKEELMYISQ